jgi:hypothetical protein
MNRTCSEASLTAWLPSRDDGRLLPASGLLVEDGRSSPSATSRGDDVTGCDTLPRMLRRLPSTLVDGT